jgi:hypothetical protein
MGNAESVKLDSLLVSGQSLAFGWEVRLGLCLDRLDLPMGYLQLQNRLSAENDDNFFTTFIGSNLMDDQYFTLSGSDNRLFGNDGR